MTQKICDTRAGVTKVKALIDGMRTTRDTQMTEMAQLKARIKEQNQRLIQLSQEKAKLDAKTKSNQANDAANQEQIQAAFSNKQVSQFIFYALCFKSVLYETLQQNLIEKYFSQQNSIKFNKKISFSDTNQTIKG